MKKPFFTAVSVMAVITVQAQETAYNISGTVPEGVEKVYLHVSGKRRAVDSTVVNAGKFAINGSKPLDEILILDINDYDVYLFNDGTPVELDAVNKTLNGSELNKKLYAYNTGFDKYDDQTKEIYAEYETLKNDTTETGKEKIKALSDKFDEIREAVMKGQLEVAKANKDNLIPAVYLSQIYYALDYDELKEMLDSNAPYYNHPAMERVKKQLEALEKRMPGKMFIDLTMNDTDGKARKLSEWCGKGYYVLVDFWASWCGPCRQEMPNVVANYKKYHDKGFEIIGVSFDTKEGAWKEAIESIGMEWPQLSDLKGWKSEGASNYGITSIPANVLIDKEGRIAALDLRDEELGNKLKEIYGF